MDLKCLLNNALHGKIWSGHYLQIDLKDATIFIQDGTTPVPNSIEVKIGEGNLTYVESRNVEYTLNRGLLDEIRLGDEIPMDVTFDFVWEFITAENVSGATPTVEDALKQIGAAIGWQSTDDDPCRPYTVDVILLHQPACTSGSNADEEIITFNDFRYDSLTHDLRAGTIACVGRCNSTEADVVRQAQS